MYSCALCNELVDDYIQQFRQRYEFSPNDIAVVCLTDALRAIYHENYHHGEDAVDVAMQDYYNSCCAYRDDAYNTNRIRGGAVTSTAVEETKTNDGELDEVNANNVVEYPTDRDARLLCRNQQHQDTAAQGGHGDGNGDGSCGGGGDGAPSDNNENHQPGALAVPNGRNGDSGPPPDDDGGDDGGDDNDSDDGSDGDPDGFYFTWRLILMAGSGLTPDNIDYNNNPQMLRQAFWLCNIQDQNHAPLFVFGDLTTFEILSSYTIAKWTQFQKSAAKWRNCLVVLNDNHIKSLTAVSLWVRVCIVLGDHDDLTALSRAQVSEYARAEVCVENTVDEVDLYTLSKLSGKFAEFYRQFQLYLDSIITLDDLMLSYVTRRGQPPATHTSLRHELQWLVPVNSDTASWKCDNKQVYYLLKKAIGDDSNARNWMNKDGAEGTWDGRRSMMSLVELYESDNEHEAKLRALRDRIKGQKYTGYGNNNARKLTSRLYEIYGQFDHLHEPYSEVEKLRNLRSFLHPQGLMSNAYFVNNLKQEIDKALKDA